MTDVDGIPCTSVARTFLDTSVSRPLEQIKTGLTEAEKLRILSRPELLEVIGRGRGWAGVVRLRQALAEWDPLEAETRSKLEIAMLRLCRSEGLPIPMINTSFKGYVPDFLWREERLIIEVDGYRDHSGKGAFRGDRRRDIDLMLAGYRVARLIDDDVLNGGKATAMRIKGLLELSRTGTHPTHRPQLNPTAGRGTHR
ncbi:MAG: endonuclease domain-containing protein [Actinomycetota bacterium]|nr:endonuclease domain-containing protein [Actinomycetota bacterium]